MCVNVNRCINMDFMTVYILYLSINMFMFLSTKIKLFGVAEKLWIKDLFVKRTLHVN